MFKGIIYQATNIINQKKYVGKSFTTTYNYDYNKLLSRRKSQHKLQMVKGQGQYFHRELKKYGWNNFKWEILEKCESKEVLDARETYWIIKNNTYAPNHTGYNLTLGGDGSTGCKRSEKAIKLSIERSSKPIVEIITKKEYSSISEASRKLNISISMISVILNNVDNCKQTKGYSFAYKKDYYNRLDYYNKLANDLQYRTPRGGNKIINVDTKEIFDTATQAAKFYKLDCSSILKCCKRNPKNKTCGGYTWRFLEEYENTEVN